MIRRVSTLLNLPGDDSERGIWPASLIDEHTPSGDVLIYGFGRDGLERGQPTNILGLPVTAYPVAGGAVTLGWTEYVGSLAGELSRFRLQLDLPEHSFVTFELPAELHARRVEVLADLDGRPWFVRFKSGERWIYLLGLAEVPDPDMVVSSASQELPLISGFVALLLFVRTHYPSQAWFSRETLGNFIIDDPLLRPRYGFVDHTRLAEAVKHSRGAATIGFIPWNARRTSAKTAALYRSTEGLGICVHGYEHIGDEFSSVQRDDLVWRAHRALANMRLHEELSGVPFDPVMVFPQGRFSSGAMEALEAAGFLAAANSTFLSADTSGRVRLKHLVEPAVTAYSAVPLFRRRSPNYLERFRYDAILGKPLLLVEHHTYFSDSGEAFRRVFGRVRDVVPGVRWVGLGQIVRRTCLVRRPRRDLHEVRFYAHRFRFRVLEAGTYEFEKFHRGGDPRAVRIDGRPVDFVVDGETLRFTAVLTPSSSDTEVLVERAGCVDTVARPARPRTSQLSVAVRRYLSELRDNCLAIVRTAVAQGSSSMRGISQERHSS